MNKKRILFILPKARQGGAETQMLYLLKGLDKNLFDVYLGFLYGDKQLQKDFKATGAKLVNFKKRSRFDIGVFFRIATFAKRNNIDIICSFLGNQHAFLPALLARKPALGGIRNTAILHLRGLQRCKEVTVQKWLTTVTKYILISNSHTAKQLYVKSGFRSKSIIVIPNGIDFRKFSYGTKTKVVKEFNLKGKFVFVSVGRLIKSKNYEALIKNFHKVLAANKNAVLLLVGEGPQMNHLQSLTKELHLSKHIFFTGNRRDVNNILASADIFLFPSISEGWPNVLGEAMCAGVPIVTYAVGDVKHILKHNYSAIISKNNMGAFITNTISLMNDKKKRISLAKKARADIQEKFSLHNMIAQYEKVFTTIVRGSK